MTSRSRKLAWEIISLLSRYSEREIDDALHDIAAGEMFQVPLELAVKARPFRTPTARKREEPQTERERIRSLMNARGLPDADDLIEFYDGIVGSTYLREGADLRELATHIDVMLPKKLPRRHVVASKIVSRLLDLPPQSRFDILALCRRGEFSRKSSLKGWSDLIVKR